VVNFVGKILEKTGAIELS